MTLEQVPLTKVLGWTVQGDLGGWTFYTSQRRRIVFYPQAPPLDPPSVDQRYFRSLWRAAANAWQALSPTQRELWGKACRAAGLRLGGNAFFFFWFTRSANEHVRTIEAQTGIKLLDEANNAIV